MNNQKMAELFAAVLGCSECSQRGDKTILHDVTFNIPQPGYVGPGYWQKRVLLIGQNPGVSPPRFRAQDEAYAQAGCRLRDNPSPDTLKRYQAVLADIIPTWPVQDNYFPLYECGLDLSDIAYFNVVRCRTRGNRVPSSGMVTACMKAHFTDFVEFLQPRIVVCVGKWAHDRVAGVLEQQGILHTFMNRMRSLSSADRARNRADVVKMVTTAIAGRPVAREAPRPIAKKQNVKKQEKCNMQPQEVPDFWESLVARCPGLTEYQPTKEEERRYLYGPWHNGIHLSFGRRKDGVTVRFNVKRTRAGEAEFRKHEERLQSRLREAGLIELIEDNYKASKTYSSFWVNVPGDWTDVAGRDAFQAELLKHWEIFDHYRHTL